MTNSAARRAERIVVEDLTLVAFVDHELDHRSDCPLLIVVPNSEIASPPAELPPPAAAAVSASAWNVFGSAVTSAA